MIHEYFTFDGKSSFDFNTWISGSGTYSAPERDVQNVSVPGKSGDLIIDNKRFKNIDVTYPAFITKDFERNFDSLKAFLLSQAGYFRLEDTYHPDYFRMAQFKGPIDPTMRTLNRSGEFELIFNCKPQRYLKSGEQTIEIHPGWDVVATIMNRTLYNATPILRIYGTGSVDINGQIITVTAADEYTDFDCELMNAYKDSPAENRNQYVQTSTTNSIVLRPGSNNFRLVGDTLSGITKIIVTPRWFTV